MTLFMRTVKTIIQVGIKCVHNIKVAKVPLLGTHYNEMYLKIILEVAFFDSVSAEFIEDQKNEINPFSKYSYNLPRSL